MTKAEPVGWSSTRVGLPPRARDRGAFGIAVVLRGRAPHRPDDRVRRETRTGDAARLGLVLELEDRVRHLRVDAVGRFEGDRDGDRPAEHLGGQIDVRSNLGRRLVEVDHREVCPQQQRARDEDREQRRGEQDRGPPAQPRDEPVDHAELADRAAVDHEQRQKAGHRRERRHDHRAAYRRERVTDRVAVRRSGSQAVHDVARDVKAVGAAEDDDEDGNEDAHDRDRPPEPGDPAQRQDAAHDRGDERQNRRAPAADGSRKTASISTITSAGIVSRIRLCRASAFVRRSIIRGLSLSRCAFGGSSPNSSSGRRVREVVPARSKVPTLNNFGTTLLSFRPRSTTFPPKNEGD